MSAKLPDVKKIRELGPERREKVRPLAAVSLNTVPYKSDETMPCVYVRTAKATIAMRHNIQNSRISRIRS
jgi:hypothetical protein